MKKEKKRYDIDAGIQEVENGYVVRVSAEDCGPSKRFVASSKPEAQSILKDALDGKIKPKAPYREKRPSDPMVSTKTRKSSKRASKKARARKKA